MGFVQAGLDIQTSAVCIAVPLLAQDSVLMPAVTNPATAILYRIGKNLFVVNKLKVISKFRQ